MPNCTLSVSPCTTITLSIEMPSRSETSCANVVSCPCPWLMATGQYLDRAGRVDPHFGGFPQADAGAELSRPAPRAPRRTPRCRSQNRCRAACRASRDFALALAETLVVVDLQRLRQRGVVVAGVIERGDRRLIRERLDEVLLAQISGLDAELARGGFHQTLDHEGRFRAAPRRDRRRPARCWCRPHRPRNRCAGSSYWPDSNVA